MDRSEREYEVKQILGSLTGSTILVKKLLVQGRNGLLIACNNEWFERNERIIVMLASILAKEMFIRAYFVKILSLMQR